MQRPISGRLLRKYPDIIAKKASIISIRLDEISLFTENLILDQKRDNEISLQILKDNILSYLGRKKENTKQIFFLDYFEDLINRMKEESYLTDDGTIYAKNTIKSYDSNLNVLRIFEEEHYQITFDRLNMEFYWDLISFCNKRDLRTNTIGGLIKRIKAVGHNAYKEGVCENDILQIEDFKAIKEKVYNIYLTEEELKRIYDLELSGTLAVYRDVFLIGCYTAQRYSDYSRILPQYIKTTSGNNKVIDMVQLKTKTRVLIPFIYPELDIILKKYNYKVPKTTEQPFNRELKTIGRLANIDSEISISENIGGRVIERVVKKYDIITSHTARRTGATNLFLRGYSSMQIMKVTGHTTEVSFLKYIKVSLEENVDEMVKKSN